MVNYFKENVNGFRYEIGELGYPSKNGQQFVIVLKMKLMKCQFVAKLFGKV